MQSPRTTQSGLAPATNPHMTSFDPAPQQDRMRPDRGFTELYENIAMYPGEGKFRRFAALWAKLLHDNTQELITNQSHVHQALKKKMPDGNTVLDCPRWVVKERYPDIYQAQWKPYEQSLREYGEILCLSEQIMKLPDQSAFATKFLEKFQSPIFYPNSSGKFGLTGEPAEVYLGPPGRHDTCAWRRSPRDDLLTMSFLRLGGWVKRHIFRRGRGHLAAKRFGKEWRGPDIDARIIIEVVDYLTCLFTSFFLTGAMFGLAHIKPLDIRIGGVGALGLIFALLVKAMAGSSSRRIEVFAATAAFYGAASVFVSNTSGTGGGN